MRIINRREVIDVVQLDTLANPEDPRLGMKEQDLQTAIVDCARHLGWKTYHTYDSRRSNPGFPDLVLVHPTRGTIFAELKTTKGRIRPEQETWLVALAEAGNRTHLWRPADWITGGIERELKGTRT